MITTKITSWEREKNTYLLVETSAPRENYFRFMERGSNVDGDESGALPRPGRVPKQEFWSPEACRRWRRRLESLLEKEVAASGFPPQG